MKPNYVEMDRVRIPEIVLNWSQWYAWDALKPDARQENGISLPTDPGCYEVRRDGAEVRLTIGRAANLRSRVKRGLVKGKIPHSTGIRIRAKEDVRKLLVRWAVTERPAAVEEELHLRHRDKYGRLPTYTEHT